MSSPYKVLHLITYKHCNCYLSKGILYFFVIATASKLSKDMLSKKRWEASTESQWTDIFIEDRNMLQTAVHSHTQIISINTYQYIHKTHPLSEWLMMEHEHFTSWVLLHYSNIC